MLFWRVFSFVSRSGRGITLSLRTPGFGFLWVDWFSFCPWSWGVFSRPGSWSLLLRRGHSGGSVEGLRCPSSLSDGQDENCRLYGPSGSRCRNGSCWPQTPSYRMPWGLWSCVPTPLQRVTGESATMWAEICSANVGVPQFLSLLLLPQFPPTLSRSARPSLASWPLTPRSCGPWQGGCPQTAVWMDISFTLVIPFPQGPFLHQLLLLVVPAQCLQHAFLYFIQSSSLLLAWDFIFLQQIRRHWCPDIDGTLFFLHFVIMVVWTKIDTKIE